ncbi:hypothetical protein B0H34DRAFT_736950 [Crassisporium funariophilum]|nr:hypothetical protein B0H34DRAFT_736950 [Crassisporium funariophilum]
MLRPEPALDHNSSTMSGTCVPHHDWFNALLTFGLCCGLVISYLPQHFRIIHAKSSEGFSPVFLLLGTTSAASGMFNMITLQAQIVKCCRVVSFGSCVEMTAGIVQVGLQWVCFSIVFVLYMIYYPPHLKYVDLDVDESGEPHLRHVKEPIKSEEWRLSIVVTWIAIAHLAFVSLTTLYLLATTTPSPTNSLPPNISAWATFLGVSSALLATIQYAPQLLHTYRMKLVGALSIPMMLIQTPGGLLMVTSIVLRPGTNWTSWITFAVAAVLQGCLLVMCIMWKFRQDRLGIDDFGNPIEDSDISQTPFGSAVQQSAETYHDNEAVPGLVTTSSENPVAVRVALARALESATEADMRAGGVVPAREADVAGAGEETPLLARRGTSASGKDGEGRGWSAWFGR